MKLTMPVVCECGFATMDAKEAVEHARQHESKEILVAENVEVDMETLRTAISANPKVYAITLARCRIVDAVKNALAPEDRKRLEAYCNGEGEE